jgi:hypothetical protein
MNNEPFVDIDAAAAFTGLKRRFLQTLAWRGIQGAYSVGNGELRKRRTFRLNELAEALTHASRGHSSRNAPANIAGICGHSESGLLTGGKGILCSRL